MTAPPTSFLPTTIGNIAGDVPHDPAMRRITPSPRANDDRRAVAAHRYRVSPRTACDPIGRITPIHSSPPSKRRAHVASPPPPITLSP
jgi:hypothetical protein